MLYKNDDSALRRNMHTDGHDDHDDHHDDDDHDDHDGHDDHDDHDDHDGHDDHDDHDEHYEHEDRDDHDDLDDHVCVCMHGRFLGENRCARVRIRKNIHRKKPNDLTLTLND